MSGRSMRFPRRSGLTIIEVLFAIGIAVVGLLGIASLLPLAARNAMESTRAAEGQALANLWYDELIVRGVGNPSSWQYFQDFSTQNSTAGYKNFSVTKEAVCIDPSFLTSRDIAPTLAAGSFNRPATGAPPDALRWYRPVLFPYYHEQYNPLLDPAYTYSAQASYALATQQPRMKRMTLGGALGRVSAKYVDEIVSSIDDLAMDVENADASIPSTRHVDTFAVNTPNSTVQVMGRLTNKGEYSWLITICPTDTLIHSQPVSQALLSLVVINKRDLLFFDPSTSSPSKTQGELADPESKPEGERVFSVTPQTDINGVPVPFKGGHGGPVTLAASDGVGSVVHVGDWVMLAKNRNAAGNPVFRWYRIVATDGDAEYGASSAVPSGDNIWSRGVVLDGPDWVFDTNYPTTATYIPGAVAVHERIISY